MVDRPRPPDEEFLPCLSATGGETVVWLMGRGISIGCGLDWEVPVNWRDLPRETQIERIKRDLSSESLKPEIDTSDIQTLLLTLRNQTTDNWQHYFVTTNWDTLLEMAIDRLRLKSVPGWLSDSAVAHLNGVIEAGNSYRSPFLLETDSAELRIPSIEANRAFASIAWSRHIIMVGMSFECRVDRGLLGAFSGVSDDLPIGESNWVVINPGDRHLVFASEQIRKALPFSRIIPVAMDFRAWLRRGLPELRGWGVLRMTS